MSRFLSSRARIAWVVFVEVPQNGGCKLDVCIYTRRRAAIAELTTISAEPNTSILRRLPFIAPILPRDGDAVFIRGVGPGVASATKVEVWAGSQLGRSHQRGQRYKNEQGEAHEIQLEKLHGWVTRLRLWWERTRWKLPTFLFLEVANSGDGLRTKDNSPEGLRYSYPHK